MNFLKTYLKEKVTILWLKLDDMLFVNNKKEKLNFLFV